MSRLKKHPLPANIHLHPKGLIVRVKRGKILLKAFVPKGWGGTAVSAVVPGVSRGTGKGGISPTPISGEKSELDSRCPLGGLPKITGQRHCSTHCLARALAIRDKFLRAVAGVQIVHTKAWSNTGVVGISETTWWHKSKPHNCFSVTWREHGKPRSYRVLFEWSDREAALQRAIELRNEKTRTPHLDPLPKGERKILSPVTCHSSPL